MADTTETPTTIIDDSIKSKIVKQINFYFSNSNLPRDEFLMKQIDDNEEGWVSLSLLNTFKRMQQYKVDTSTVAEMVKETSTEVAVNEDGTKVRRIAPMIKGRQDYNARSIYAKGFPVDTTTIDSIEATFSSFGVVRAVRLRRMEDKERTFKGSVFVEMDSEELAKKIVETGVTLDGAEEPLLIMLKTDYIAMKAIKYEGQPYKNGRKNKFNNKRRRDNDNVNSNKQSKSEESSTPVEELIPGRVMKVSGLGNEASREDLKAAFGADRIEWIDYSRGEEVAYLRFKEEGSAKVVLDDVTKDGAKVSVRETEVNMEIVEGDAETAYHTAYLQGKAERAARFQEKRGGRAGKRGGRGGRGKPMPRRTNSKKEDAIAQAVNPE